MIHLASQPRRTDPLTVFMHIPKTAGSSVNARLAAELGPGSKRIIHLVDRPGLLRWTLARSVWVSGHVHFPRLDAALNAATGRDLRYVTVFRDPVAHLASHYNWYIEIHRRGWPTYARYSRYQRSVSRQIRHTDNTDPDAVAAVLKRHHGLFLNIQSRYLVGGDAIRSCGSADLRRALDRFVHAGRADRLDQFHAALGLSPDRQLHVNASPYAFDPEVFRSRRLRRLLRRRHALDLALWDIIRERG